MRFAEIKAFVQTIAAPPATENGLTKWLSFEDAIEFLIKSVSQDVPIHLVTRDLFVYGVFVAEEQLIGDFGEDLLNWNFSASGGWGYGFHGRQDGKITPEIFAPLENTGSTVLRNVEPITFLRFFEGCREQQSYVELNQRISHICDVHWESSRRAYCRLDRRGDIEEVIQIKRDDNNLICTINRSDLDFYMFLTKTALVRVFDFRRSPTDWPLGAIDQEPELRRIESDFQFKSTALVDGGTAVAGICRGFQVIRIREAHDTLIRRVKGERDQDDRYQDFLIQDWKNRRLVDWSCAPDQLANYFVASNLPYFTSPCFFNPEILMKYKSDPDKYTVDQRQISCRGAWLLETYDINTAGQVHTYVGYLGRLPYEEQVYWRSFNEAPKAKISKRAFLSDFEGKWDDQWNPLYELQATLREFPSVIRSGKKIAIWGPPTGSHATATDRIRYVVTGSSKEWLDEVTHLSGVVVDGFKEAELRMIARELRCDDPTKKSLGLLGELLRASGVESADASAIVNPLVSLRSLRSQGGAHGQGRVPAGDLRESFKEIVGAVSLSMAHLAGLIRRGVLNEPRPGTGAA